jgi:hypothetical protein
MVIQVEHTRNVDDFAGVIAKVTANKKVKSLLIMSCDANGFTPETVDPVLKKAGVPVFGGIFPALIYGSERMDQGSIVVGLSQKTRVAVIPDLSDNNLDYVKLIDHYCPETGSVKTMFVFVDGFAKRIDAFIGSLFTVFGLENNYIGGGAGSLSLTQKPCLFTPGGLIRDGAVLALLDLHSGVGVSHGWESIRGPFKVTESDRNRIISLNWKPAFDLYKEVVEEHTRQRFDENNFFEISKAFPFGIAKIGAEGIVRDPLLVEADHSLVCVGEVPEGSFIDILKGDEHSLIKAAASALLKSKEAFQDRLGHGKNRESNLTIFIDCISRVLFLGERFNEELNSVYQASETQTLIGACTIGEIANSGSDYLEFYNKTSVVAQLEEI